MYLNSREKRGGTLQCVCTASFFFAKRSEKVGNIAKRNAAVRESTMGLNPLRNRNLIVGSITISNDTVKIFKIFKIEILQKVS